MTPTNWPNPERPGVPLFPERDGWHWISNKEGGGLYPCKWVFVPESIYGGFWDCAGNRVFPYIIARTDNYLAPCLTPEQIAEMLAGGGRCAVIAEDNTVSMENSETESAVNELLEITAREIRNLGAAS